MTIHVDECYQKSYFSDRSMPQLAMYIWNMFTLPWRIHMWLSPRLQRKELWWRYAYCSVL